MIPFYQTKNKHQHKHFNKLRSKSAETLPQTHSFTVSGICKTSFPKLDPVSDLMPNHSPSKFQSLLNMGKHYTKTRDALYHHHNAICGCKQFNVVLRDHAKTEVVLIDDSNPWFDEFHITTTAVHSFTCCDMKTFLFHLSMVTEFNFLFNEENTCT